MKYKVLHTRAGDFKQGEELTAKQIEDSGANVEDWVKAGAIVSASDADQPEEDSVAATSQAVQQGDVSVEDAEAQLNTKPRK